MLFNLLLDSSGTETGCNNSQIWTPILIVVGVLFIIALFVMPMITNKKQKKNVEEQRSNLSVGDTIETVGGIIGVIREIREPAPGRKELVIETGVSGSATTLTVDIQALYVVLNRVGGAPVAASASAPSKQSEIIKLNDSSASAAVTESAPEAGTPFPEADGAAEAAVTEDTAQPAGEDAAPAAEAADAPVRPRRNRKK